MAQNKLSRPGLLGAISEINGLQATATAKPFATDPWPAGQVYADECWEKPREWLLGRYQARQYR